MTIRMQIMLLIILFIVLGIIISMVKKRALELKYVLVWIVGDIILIFFTIFPQCMDVLAKIMGIQSPVNMIFFLGFLFSLVIIFILTVALSRVSARVRRMAQILAMLPEELQNKIDEKSE